MPIIFKVIFIFKATFAPRAKVSIFIEIIRAIDKIMFAQKFEGAASGAFNANIIARDLGLTDKSELKVTEEQPLFGDGEDD